MNDAPSLADRFFWPATVMATLVLGGFVTVVCQTVARSSPQAVATAPVESQTAATAKAPKLAAAEPSVAPVREVEVEATPPAPKSAPEAPAVEVAVADTKPEPEAAVTPPPKPKSSDEESPYVVPTNKPYISSSDFGAPQRLQDRKKPPVPPKTPVPTPPKPAIAAAKPPAPPMPAAKVVMPDAPKGDSNSSAMSVVPRNPVYVLKDGRKIPALKVVDLGNSYGLKTPGNQLLTVPKQDVVNIEK